LELSENNEKIEKTAIFKKVKKLKWAPMQYRAEPLWPSFA
jgi:hypothetical protein